MEDIESVFHGPFKGQKDMDSNWLPVQSQLVPTPRPGKCSNDSQNLPDQALNFIKEHPLMDHTVQSFWSSPLLIQNSFSSRFVSIAVDPQVETSSGKAYDVLYIGTNNGTVLKAINVASPSATNRKHPNSVVPVIIEEITVFSSQTPVTQLAVYSSYYNPKLVVFSQSQIKSFRLHRCQAKTCSECVRLKDPYCSFDLKMQKCSSSRSRYWNRENFVQNIELGTDRRCPEDEERIINEDHFDLQANLNDNLVYSSETFALAVVTSIVTSLVFGFIIGYIFSRRCQKYPDGCSHYDGYRDSYLDRHHFAGALAAGRDVSGHHVEPNIRSLYGAQG